MIKEFPYCRSTPNGKHICECDTPYLTVTLSNAGFQLTIEGMVDSGCTMTLADSAFAPVLGIDVSTCPEVPIGGIGGSVNGRMSSLEITVPGFDIFTSKLFFVENLPVPILLGQLDFFNHFDINFQKSQLKFTLNDKK